MKLFQRLFAGVVLLFLLVIGLSPVESVTMEKRKLADFPKWDATYPWGFGFGVIDYFEDRFAFKNTLVKWNSLVKLKWLKVSPNINTGIVGENGWLYYSEPSYLDKISTPYSEKQMEKLGRNMTIIKHWFAERGIAYTFFIIPVKPHVYYQDLPPLYAQLFQNSNLENLLSYQKKTGNSTFISCKEELTLEAKTNNSLYFKTDTHWSQTGAFIGYKVLMKELLKQDSSLQVINEEHFKLSPFVMGGGDVQRLFGIKNVMYSSADSLKFHSVCVPNLKKHPKVMRYTSKCALNNQNILFIRDSFMESMKPIINQTFNEATYYWDGSVPLEVVDKVAPKYIVHELLERFIYSLFELPEYIQSDKEFLKRNGYL